MPGGLTRRWEGIRQTVLDGLDQLTRVSSESDSAALAPLQQDLRVSAEWLVHNPSVLER
jgi:hypothetical protein